MNIGIFYCCGDRPFMSHDYVYGGGGGTETCIVQLAEKMAESHSVKVLCACDRHFEYGVDYVPLQDIDKLLKDCRFDFILLECYYRGIVSSIRAAQPGVPVLLLHSLNYINEFNVYNGRSQAMSDYRRDSELNDGTIRKFIALSESQAAEYQTYNGVPAEKIVVIPNCVDERMFDECYLDEPRDHRILWSSNLSRGVELLQQVAPKVQKRIPDFGVDIATPSYCRMKAYDTPWVRFIGTLSKVGLYAEMRKHACWWYPSTFNETFCITSVEAAANGNLPVLPLVNGPATIFKEFRDAVGMKTCALDGEAFIKESADRIADAIENFQSDENRRIRRALYEHIMKDYSRQVVSDSIIQAAIQS